MTCAENLKNLLGHKTCLIAQVFISVYTSREIQSLLLDGRENLECSVETGSRAFLALDQDLDFGHREDHLSVSGDWRGTKILVKGVQDSGFFAIITVIHCQM